MTYCLDDAPCEQQDAGRGGDQQQTFLFLDRSAFFDAAGNGDAEQGDGQDKECRQQEDVLWEYLQQGHGDGLFRIEVEKAAAEAYGKAFEPQHGGRKRAEWFRHQCREHQRRQYEVGGKGGEQAADESRGAAFESGYQQ